MCSYFRNTRHFFIIAALMAMVISLAISCSSPPRAEKSTRQQASKPKSQAKVDSSEGVKPAEIVEEPVAKANDEKVEKAEVKTDIAAARTSREVTNPTANRKATKPHRRYEGYPGEIAYVKGSNKVALTFDAGASSAPTSSILKTLKEAGLHVTFFLTGKWCEKDPELVKQIIAEGHEIANHSYSHPDFRKISDSAIVEQLQKTEDIVFKLTGASTKPFFRPPFGGRDKRVLSVAGEQGYTSIYWSLDSWDAFKKGITAQQIEDRILERIQGGDIVLMHCGSEPTAKQLPDLIEQINKRGFEIVKVSELVKDR
ncbi:MAG: polysaccharide deacetylase family protein [Armatimonadota bacterium]